MGEIRVKRAYEPPASDDGERYLVDRLWPRGLKKEELNSKGWLKEAAPSTELRKWFNHEPAKWEEFRGSYRRELESRPESLETLLQAAQRGNVTLLYGARESRFNNAVVLREVLMEKLVAGSRKRQPSKRKVTRKSSPARVPASSR